MQPHKVVIGHSWIDVSLNIQTKAVAFALSQSAKVYFLTQSRIRETLPGDTNLKVLEWPNKRPTRLKDFIFALKLVKSIRPDLIIVHFASTKALLFAGWMFGVKYRVAWYHTLYGQTKLEAPNKWRAHFDVWVRTVAYKMATHVIAQTQFAADDAINNQSVHPGKMHIIPNGMLAPVARRTAYVYNTATVTCLYVGRITYTKGCDLLIPVFEKLTQKHSNVFLQFVGAGDAAKQLQSLVEANSLQSKVICKGATQSYAAVYEEMMKSYILLVPSRIDNYPTVIIEAMACGLPVLGANTGGIPYMIEDGVDGFICNDANDWLEKCERLIDNPHLRNTMAANARNTFEKKYTIERHVEKVINFFGSLPG